MARKQAYVPTTAVLDTQRIYSVDVKSPEFKELLVELWNTVNSISLLCNMKDTGYYGLEEIANSQYYYPNPADISVVNTPAPYRGVLRKVINFGALPNSAAKNAAHGITTTDNYSFTRIYGVASDQATPRHYIPLPYASTVLANNIELAVDETNVTITTAANYTAFTTTYVILEYITT